ncbi:MAG: hypothetical protein V3V01_00935 [Acidimicrobiales bacterium]
MVTADLVPAHRFSPLLAEQRLLLGLDLTELATLSNGRFTSGELADFEAGNSGTDQQIVDDLCALYGIDFRAVLPQRVDLILDVGVGRLVIAGSFEPIDRFDQQQILERYLSLVYLLRGVDAGSEISLRRHDLLVLGASLDEPPHFIEERLLAAMAANDPILAGLLKRFRAKRYVPGAGLLVGAVGLGALVFVAQPPTTPSLVGGGTAATEVAVDSSLTSTSPVAAFTDTTPLAIAVPNPAASYVRAVEILGIDLSRTLPGWTIEARGGVDQYRGLTFADDKRIEIFVRADDTPESVAGVLAHEVAHALDVSFLNDDQRLGWLTARGIDTQWWVSDGLSDFSAGQGDFAEAFSVYLLDDSNDSTAAGLLTEEQLALMGQMVDSLIRSR